LFDRDGPSTSSKRPASSVSAGLPTKIFNDENAGRDDDVAGIFFFSFGTIEAHQKSYRDELTS